MLSKCLTKIPGGEVKAFLCTHVIEAISYLELSEVASSIDGKAVVQTWEKLPEHESVLEDILQALANGNGFLITAYQTNAIKEGESI
jgi:hypothetical protein